MSREKFEELYQEGIDTGLWDNEESFGTAGAQSLLEGEEDTPSEEGGTTISEQLGFNALAALGGDSEELEESQLSIIISVAERCLTTHKAERAIIKLIHSRFPKDDKAAAKFLGIARRRVRRILKKQEKEKGDFPELLAKLKEPEPEEVEEVEVVEETETIDATGNEPPKDPRTLNLEEGENTPELPQMTMEEIMELIRETPFAPDNQGWSAIRNRAHDALEVAFRVGMKLQLWTSRTGYGNTHGINNAASHVLKKTRGISDEVMGAFTDRVEEVLSAYGVTFAVIKTALNTHAESISEPPQKFEETAKEAKASKEPSKPLTPPPKTGRRPSILTVEEALKGIGRPPAPQKEMTEEEDHNLTTFFFLWQIGVLIGQFQKRGSEFDWLPVRRRAIGDYLDKKKVPKTEMKELNEKVKTFLEEIPVDVDPILEALLKREFGETEVRNEPEMIARTATVPVIPPPLSTEGPLPQLLHGQHRMTQMLSLLLHQVNPTEHKSPYSEEVTQLLLSGELVFADQVRGGAANMLEADNLKQLEGDVSEQVLEKFTKDVAQLHQEIPRIVALIQRVTTALNVINQLKDTSLREALRTEFLPQVEALLRQMNLFGAINIQTELTFLARIQAAQEYAKNTKD